MMAVSQYERPAYVTAANRLMVEALMAGAVEIAAPTAILSGIVTLSGAAQNFPAGACKSVTIENVSTNAIVAVGNAATVTLINSYVLRPGATISLDIDNLNRIWVIGTAPQIITYIAVN